MVQRKLWTEFQTFVLKGNVVELAVAVVVGGAFNKVVKAFVDDLVMPALSPLLPAGDWRAWEATPLHLKLGDLIGSLVDFFIVSFVVFLVLVKLVGQLTKKEAEIPATKKCAECLSDVPREAKRCSHCSQPIMDVVAAGAKP